MKTGFVMLRRRAFTLLEMVAALAAASVLVGITVSLLHSLLLLEGKIRDQFRSRSELARLAEQFRDDVRAATEVNAVAPQAGRQDAPAWELHLAADRRVRYQVQATELVRSERSGDKTVRQDVFSLPPGAAVSIDSEPGKPVSIVSLRIIPARPAPNAALARPVRIDAALSADGRFVPRENRK